MKRRKSREYALQMLFHVDFTEKKISSRDFSDFWSDKKADKDIRQFTEELVKGTLMHLDEIDQTIQRVAENWVLERMASVDRTILRFATYEILYRKDIPSAVTINEALEIAKKFSSSEAAPFLNGILDRLARDVRKA